MRPSGAKRRSRTDNQQLDFARRRNLAGIFCFTRISEISTKADGSASLNPEIQKARNADFYDIHLGCINDRSQPILTNATLRLKSGFAGGNEFE